MYCRSEKCSHRRQKRRNGTARYTSEIAYHTIDGVDSFCIEPNTSSLNGQYYSSCTAEEASSSSYWKLELDDLQRSHIQKILAFGYPQVDYGYSRQVQYAATQVLIWEVVSHSRYNTDIKSCSDYGLYSNVYAVLGADFQSCYDGILNAISVSDGTVPSFAGASKSNAKSITLTLNNSTGCYEGSVRDNNSRPTWLLQKALRSAPKLRPDRGRRVMSGSL